MKRTELTKDFLNQEIERLSRLIEEARKSGEDCSEYREELIRLIIELDLLYRGD